MKTPFVFTPLQNVSYLHKTTLVWFSWTHFREGGSDVGGLGSVGRRSSDVGVDGEKKRHCVAHFASLLSQSVVVFCKGEEQVLRHSSKGYLLDLLHSTDP